MDKEILQPKRRKKSYRRFHDWRKNDIRKCQAGMSSIQQQQPTPSTPQQQPKPTPPPKPTPTQQPKATPCQQRPKSTRSAVVKPTSAPTYSETNCTTTSVSVNVVGSVSMCAQTAEPTTHTVLLQVDTYHPWNVNLTLHLLHETVQDESVAHFL